MIRNTAQGKLLRQGAAILCIGLCSYLAMTVYQHAGDPTPSVLLGKTAPLAAQSPLKVTASKLAEGDEADAEADAGAVRADKYVKDTSDGAGMVHSPILLRTYAPSRGPRSEADHGRHGMDGTCLQGLSGRCGSYIVAMSARAPGAQSLSRKTSSKHSVV